MFQVIYYARRTLNDAQLNYATTEKELLAIVFTFDKFRPYLIGNKATVHTDHSAIKYLMKKKRIKTETNTMGTPVARVQLRDKR